MLKILLKKQMLELFHLFFRFGDGKKKRSKGAVFGYAFLMLYLVAVFFFQFYLMMNTLCAPLVSIGLDWLYFTLAGILALALSVIGSIFMTQSILYEAKDNEQLLSLPIPPRVILLARMLGLYLQNLLFCSLVLLPAGVVYAVEASITVTSVILCAFLALLLPLLALALSCILAYLTAVLTARMRKKTLFTMILSLGLLGGYMALYMQLYKALNYLVEHGAAVGESVKNAAYPLYLMGKAATGDLLSFVWFALTVALLFAVIYALLSVSFIRIATARRGAAKVEYRRHAMRKNSVFKALFLKEVRRFTGSAMYMLNSGLGSIILPIGCVAAIIKRNDMLAYADMIPGFRENLPLIALVAICSIAAMNMVTAPSVSLEGRNLWLLKSLPVRGADILNAKLLLHMLVTAPIAAVSGMVFAVLLKPGAVLSLILVVTPVIMTLVCGELGLIFNLLMPKLDWTNETYAVKQSMSVLVTMLTGWGILMVFGLLYPVLSIPGDWYCTGCTLLLILAAGMLYRVLVGWGSRKLMAL